MLQLLCLHINALATSCNICTGYDLRRKERKMTTPVVVNSVRSLVLYQAAQREGGEIRRNMTSACKEVDHPHAPKTTIRSHMHVQLAGITTNCPYHGQLLCLNLDASASSCNICMSSYDLDMQDGATPTSTSRVHRDHSSWTAVMGCTLWARRKSSGPTSLNPIYLILPSSTSA